MPAFERRYLFIKVKCDHIYGVFRKNGANNQPLGGINPIYLSTAKRCGIFFEISTFKNRHSLSEIIGLN